MKSSFRTFACLLGEFVAFASLLFVVRFIVRGHLVPQLDEECTLGGIAVDMLAHGIRFPLRAYAPNDYENGFFYSGLLVAGSFSLLGRRVLALKLPTHLVVSAGAVATLWLLRSCLDELRLNSRQVRWTAITVLVVATAFSPREIALFSTCAVGIGSHAEGTAIDMVLLALFARRRAGWSALRTAAFWVLVGLAVHVNKGTLILACVLAIAELSLSQSSLRHLGAALLGFLLGSAPEFATMASAGSAIGGWATIASKLDLHAGNFPWAFIRDVLTLADYRGELLATWLLAVGLALALLQVVRRRRTTPDDAGPPSALAMTFGLFALHAAGLTTLAQGGVDYYALHVYPPLVVLTAVLAAWVCAAASKYWGVPGTWAGAIVVGLMLVVHRPDTLRPGFEHLSGLWSKRGGAACSWRLGETFLRTVDHPSPGTLAPSERDGQSQSPGERDPIELCRSLSEVPQILDCIGGLAREAHFRWERLDGEPPPGLSGVERSAYAFYYGVRRDGRMTACDEFLDTGLATACRTAVQLDCFIRLDIATRFASGHPLGQPHCDIPEPPMDGYYAEMRSELLSRPMGRAPELPREFGREQLAACKTLVDPCY